MATDYFNYFTKLLIYILFVGKVEQKPFKKSKIFDFPSLGHIASAVFSFTTSRL